MLRSPWFTLLGSPRAAAVGRFVGSALLLCGLGLALLFDVGYGTLGHQGTGITLYVSTAVAAAGVLPAAGIRLPHAVLAWTAVGVAAVSLACSLALRHAAASGAVIDEASDTYTFFEPAALIVLLLLTARRGSPAGTAVALPLLLTAVVLRPLAVEVGEGSSILALIGTLLASGALAAGLTGRLVALSRHRREERIRLEQRLGFARDLHDFVAHHISGIVVQAQGARAVAARKPQAVGDALELIEATGAEALTAMRRMVGALRADTVPDPRTPGTDAVRALVTGCRLPGAHVGFTESGPAGHLPADAANLVERVVMEALTNVRRHARDCTAVGVHLDVSRRRVTARISDDGHSRPADGTGYGLRGLREVTEAAGGTLTAGPGPEAGWRVDLALPLPLRQALR
ncbi:sensor histidine kinase [Streptomyces sp. CRN 30]|uniref:sensor histidine kinase n=1 Tax=Streptomyces sp. CRN 30 TaxID=3075613 RepID=UPI002A81BE8E|nr:histidine kinase [Streptomyces sp. CRN 30]